MRDASPELVADVTLYPTEEGGRKTPTSPDWFGCPCFTSKEHLEGWDCRILLQGVPLSPGETRRVGMVFLSPDLAVLALRKAGKFYLWEGHAIGEGVVV
jgi:hypothetical protein